jgi:hypothetical protein
MRDITAARNFSIDSRQDGFIERVAGIAGERVAVTESLLTRVEVNSKIDGHGHLLRGLVREMSLPRLERSSRGVPASSHHIRLESLHMPRKGQVKRLDGRDATGQAKSVAELFGVAA